jgi:hypothetical protein
MPQTLPAFKEPFTAGLVTISAGGANEITFVECPGAPANAVVTVVPTTNAMQTTNAGDEGTVIDATKAFPILTGGTTEIPGTGWGREDGILRLRLSAAITSSTANVMVARK